MGKKHGVQPQSIQYVTVVMGWYTDTDTNVGI